MPFLREMQPLIPFLGQNSENRCCPPSSDCSGSNDITERIAPPYDVMTAESKQALLDADSNNIVAVDLPFLPPKAVGPDEVYQKAGEQFRAWIDQGVLVRHPEPVLMVYVQQYAHGGQTYARKGLIGLVPVQEFGPGPEGAGGVFPHEKTFAAAKEDRLKLMRATEAQLSPIFGLYEDTAGRVGPLLDQVVDGRTPDSCGKSADGTVHQVYMVSDRTWIAQVQEALKPADVFIADGHHRYTTAIRYREEVGPGKGADGCMFVLVEMGDPGLVVLPTHRVLGGMKPELTMEQLAEAAQGVLRIEKFASAADSASAAERLAILGRLEQALPAAGDHAMGLGLRSSAGGVEYAITTTVSDDPLADRISDHSKPWRMLDVAVLQHGIVEPILNQRFAVSDQGVTWKFPHELSVLDELMVSGEYPMGVVMQPTPLASVAAISRAGELMPQKSTFFFPKLATGFAVHSLA